LVILDHYQDGTKARFQSLKIAFTSHSRIIREVRINMEDKKLKKVYEKINDIRMMIGGTLSAEGVTHEDFVKDLNYVSEELDKIVDDYNKQ